MAEIQNTPIVVDKITAPAPLKETGQALSVQANSPDWNKLGHKSSGEKNNEPKFITFSQSGDEKKIDPDENNADKAYGHGKAGKHHCPGDMNPVGHGTISPKQAPNHDKANPSKQSVGDGQHSVPVGSPVQLPDKQTPPKR